MATLMPPHICIYDKGFGDLLPRCASQAITVFGQNNVQAGELLQWSDPVTRLQESRYALGHLTREQFGKLLSNPPATLQAVIRVSSAGAGGMDSYREPYRLTERGPWILHLIDRSGELTDKKWEELWQRIQGWDLQVEPDAALAAFFTADHVEELWALHVLCEASQLAVSSPDGKIQKPSDWLAPFDQRPRPGGLFDPSGTLDHQRFMQARQADQSAEPTSQSIADCLRGVLFELTTLKQI